MRENIKNKKKQQHNLSIFRNGGGGGGGGALDVKMTAIRATRAVYIIMIVYVEDNL